MTERTVRTPYEHTLAEINETNATLNAIGTNPDGTSRGLDGPTAVGALTVRSNLTIASALLAVADALINTAKEPRP
ncbi:hypothetical protein ABZ883_14765 [Streptomyces sp. NPDC046977]|uniref:hypothetical protein n=1 Tax=Streptomyces sp. NPDC046977 TaxID=3154703 RepID=UPI0033F30D87